MKVDQKLPNYDVSREVYNEDSSQMMSADFANSIKIKHIRQIGCGG